VPFSLEPLLASFYQRIWIPPSRTRDRRLDCSADLPSTPPLPASVRVAHRRVSSVCTGHFKCLLLTVFKTERKMFSLRVFPFWSVPFPPLYRGDCVQNAVSTLSSLLTSPPFPPIGSACRANLILFYYFRISLAPDRVI